MGVLKNTAVLSGGRGTSNKFILYKNNYIMRCSTGWILCIGNLTTYVGIVSEGYGAHFNIKTNNARRVAWPL